MRQRPPPPVQQNPWLLWVSSCVAHYGASSAPLRCRRAHSGVDNTRGAAYPARTLTHEAHWRECHAGVEVGKRGLWRRGEAWVGWQDGGREGRSNYGYIITLSTNDWASADVDALVTATAPVTPAGWCVSSLRLWQPVSWITDDDYDDDDKLIIIVVVVIVDVCNDPFLFLSSIPFFSLFYLPTNPSYILSLLHQLPLWFLSRSLLSLHFMFC